MFVAQMHGYTSDPQTVKQYPQRYTFVPLSPLKMYSYDTNMFHLGGKQSTEVFTAPVTSCCTSLCTFLRECEGLRTNP